MTENNKDNNKNIFVKIIEWCKRSFLHPTTMTVSKFGVGCLNPDKKIIKNGYPKKKPLFAFLFNEFFSYIIY